MDDPRLRATCDLMIPEAREYVGLHDYDGIVQDLSQSGVRAALDRLGGPPLDDPHDEAQLATFEEHLRVTYRELELHRRNPLIHAANLDVSGYDRAYAPEPERAAAKRRHLAAWPDAVDAAISALDAVPAPVAEALIGPVAGLSAGLDPDRDEVERAALDAHARLVAHVELAARSGPPDAALGEAALRRLMGSGEALELDLGQLAASADAERDRLRALLTESCRALEPGAAPEELVGRLLADHPDAGGVLDEARALTAEVIDFTRDHDLVPHVDGECLVGPAPESRRWAMAMMSPAAPYEDEGPSWYHVTPPEPSWPRDEQEDWLSVFNRTSLPAITAHEVSPGHFAHGRSLRRAATPVRRALHSGSFVEGWAHYAEEMMLEEGFRGGDPRYAVGVCLEALVRVTRLACAIGLHTGAMTVDDATRRFAEDAFLKGPAARSEANRGTFDPTYGRYTWGKLAILDLRERARAAWGAGYSARRFHAAMLDLGSPALGLLGTAIERG
ncbi:MAG: DUF885 family protein [Frankiaceae bacterium]